MNRTQLTIRFSIQQTIHWAITGIGVPIFILVFQQKGLTLTEIGTVMATWVASTALLEIPLGAYADRYGRVKTYLTSLITLALGCFGLIIADQWLGFIASATLLGASRAIYSGTLDAWFYDLFTTSQGKRTYHQSLAIINFMTTVGLALGSLIGGWLPQQTFLLDYGLSPSLNINLIFMIVLCGALLIMTPFLLPEPPNHQYANTDKKFAKQALRLLFNSTQHPTIGRLFKVGIVYGWVLSGLENLWQPYLNQLNPNQSSVAIFGVVSALYFLMAGSASLLSHYALRLFNQSHRLLLTYSRAGSAIALIALSLSPNVCWFAASYLLFFFMFTLGNNSEQLLINQHTPSSHRASILSLHSFVITSGAIISSLSLGWLADQFTISIAWQISSLLLILSCKWLLSLPSQKQQQLTPYSTQC